MQWMRLKTSPGGRLLKKKKNAILDGKSWGIPSRHHKFQYSNSPILADLEVQDIFLGNRHILHIGLLLEL